MYRYEIAKNEDEKRAVLPLIKKLYVEQGYISKDSENNSFTTFLLSPFTQVFMGYANDVLFATISLVPDSDLGLPMDDLFKDELKPFKQKKIAEVTQYAVDHETLKEQDKSLTQIGQFMSSVPLLKIVLKTAKEKKIDYLCIAINPKHDPFYKSIGFVSIGELKYYPKVNNAPALPRILDITTLENNEKLPGFLKNLD